MQYFNFDYYRYSIETIFWACPKCTEKYCAALCDWVHFDEMEDIQFFTLPVCEGLKFLFYLYEDDGWKSVDVGIDCLGRQGNNFIAFWVPLRDYTTDVDAQPILIYL